MVANPLDADRLAWMRQAAGIAEGTIRRIVATWMSRGTHGWAGGFLARTTDGAYLYVAGSFDVDGAALKPVDVRRMAWAPTIGNLGGPPIDDWYFGDTSDEPPQA